MCTWNFFNTPNSDYLIIQMKCTHNELSRDEERKKVNRKDSDVGEIKGQMGSTMVQLFIVCVSIKLSLSSSRQ